jgi:Bacterial Ig-like domain (group 3)
MRQNASASGTICLLGAFAAAFLLAGCGDFWQNPNGTATGTTASSVTLTPANTSITAGATDVLTATVSPSAATGTVTFLNSGTAIGTGTLSSGIASYTATFATAGTETLTAQYGGDSTYASSVSAAVTVTVSAASDGAFRNLAVPAEAARETNLVLDPASAWTVPASSYLHNVAGVALSGGPDQSTVQNIDGEGHCVFYSGSIYTSSGATEDKGTYALSGGGFLAPAGTTGLDCN